MLQQILRRSREFLTFLNHRDYNKNMKEFQEKQIYSFKNIQES